MQIFLNEAVSLALGRDCPFAACRGHVACTLCHSIDIKLHNKKGEVACVSAGREKNDHKETRNTMKGGSPEHGLT